jgi:hypothetical protein
MNGIKTVLLDFKPEFNAGLKKPLRDGLSAIARTQDTLWLGNDETISLERLTFDRRQDDGSDRYADHTQFGLDQFLRLPIPRPPQPGDIVEADIEGLDYHDGYLWLVGSHSLKRKQPEEGKTVSKNLERLATVSSDGNRFLLAQIPVLRSGTTFTLEKVTVQGNRRRTAAQLQGADRGNALIEALAQDEHLGAFLAIPGKDNGFDIEGFAVAGARVFIGLRGPVLRGWAVIVEVALDEVVGDPSSLILREPGPDHRLYRKHFLQLDGLGIRDLCVQGSDLLILAGPTMDVDGPVTIFRWRDGARPQGDSMVFARQLTIVARGPDVQGANKGRDHAEGMTLLGDAPPAVMVVYDAVAKARQRGANGVTADIFELHD